MPEATLAKSPQRYSIDEIARLTGTKSRTIRHYVSQGLVPPAQGRGPTATYSGHHIKLLMRIRGMKEEGKTLKDIRAEIASESGGLDRILDALESSARARGLSIPAPGTYDFWPGYMQVDIVPGEVFLGIACDSDLLTDERAEKLQRLAVFIGNALYETESED